MGRSSSIWTPLHVDILGHPKFSMLADMAGISDVDLARSKVERLWIWALQYRPKGNLDGISAAALAKICCVESYTDPDKWYKALMECNRPFSGIIEVTQDGCPVIHDWEEYGGRCHIEREKGREYMRRVRKGEPFVPQPPPDNGPWQGLLSAYAFCKTPALETKIRTFEDMKRQGITMERIMAAANDPMSRTKDFYQIISPLRNGKPDGAVPKKTQEQMEKELEAHFKSKGLI